MPFAGASSQRPPVLQLEGLAVRFGKFEVLKGITGELRGRAIGLLGPNGAGKTTLLHTLLGFYAPASGSARVLGHDIVAETERVRSLIGYMPEREAFIQKMSGIRFVRMMGEIAGLPADTALERAHEALFYVGLGEARYRPMESYSYGMKQLAKLAQCLVHGPRLLFLDEPTAGLDPPARNRMLELIREIRDSGDVSIILSSHLLRDVEECCDEVLVMKSGEIARIVDLEAERLAATSLLELEVSGQAAAFAAQAGRVLGAESALLGPKRLKLVLPDGVTVQDVYRLADDADVQLRRVGFKRDSLEDIFLAAIDGRTPVAPSLPAPAAPSAPAPETFDAPDGEADMEDTHGSL
jgi:ABC-2 type transport system ATP-binding protein